MTVSLDNFRYQQRQIVQSPLAFARSSRVSSMNFQPAASMINRIFQSFIDGGAGFIHE